MQIVCDVWEGALDVDEPTLRAGGVAGLIIRLNDMNGGHHMDANFWTQWEQAEAFLRMVYFVYNPWVSGRINFEWLMDHLPGEVKTKKIRTFPDVEVVKSDCPPEEYADEVETFHNLLTAQVRVAIYTGAWFLSLVARWPGGDYWWGRYPYYLCPRGDRVFWTWEVFAQRANAYGYKPDPLKKCPGNPILWQCSGDKVILPGTANRAMDLSLWNGSIETLSSWVGTDPPIISKLDILWREATNHPPAGWDLSS